MPSRLSVVLIIAALAACETTSKNPLAGTPFTRVNFYSASVGLANAQQAFYPGQVCTLLSQCSFDFIYVDTYDTSRKDYPYVEPGGIAPYNYSAFAYPQDTNVNVASGLEHVNYMHLPSGTRRFRFSYPTHAVIADTTTALATGHSTILYLNDSLLSYYRVISLDETSTGPGTGIRVRLLNLSPDAGPIEVYVLGSAGQYIFPNLPQNIPFDSVTPYVTLDSSLALKDGNIYLKFFTGIDTSTALATAIVPSATGRSYHVVFEGNVFGETLNYPSSSGSGQTPVTINPAVVAWVRETF